MIETTLIIVGIIGGILAISSIIFFNPFATYLFGDSVSKNPRGEFLKVILQAIGGFILLIGALYSLGIANAMNENNKLVEKGNTSTRFKDAVEMLDDSKTNTCLAGIYALHQIAKDNPEYHEQVLIFLWHILILKQVHCLLGKRSLNLTDLMPNHLLRYRQSFNFYSISRIQPIKD